VSASLSTHVLDTARGAPASGVRVELFRAGDVIAEGETDGDGRLRLGDDLESGPFRLVFHPPSEFFTRIELEIQLGEGHFHIPLLVSPFGCSTYRGS
jgi:5-hydroxyisourate hydrolase